MLAGHWVFGLGAVVVAALFILGWRHGRTIYPPIATAEEPSGIQPDGMPYPPSLPNSDTDPFADNNP